MRNLDQLLEGEIGEAVLSGLSDEFLVDVEDARLDDFFRSGGGELLFEGAGVFRRDALHAHGEQLLGTESVESGGFHAGDELRRDVRRCDR